MLDKKTPAEIAILREGGLILGQIRDALADSLKVGMTGLELDAQAEKLIKEAGGRPAFKHYHGFPNALCVSVNQTVVHGIPNKIPFQIGDLVGIDIGMEYKGFYTDTAVTVGIGDIGEQAEELLSVCQQALQIGILAVKPGGYISDIGKAIEKYVKPYGFGIVRDLTGHGVGRAVHEDPYIPNYNPGKRLEEMFPGLVLAIEPMITLGGDFAITIAKNNWDVQARDQSLTAHFEHTVVVTETGHEILTDSKINK